MKTQVPTETLVDQNTPHASVLVEHPAFGMVSITRGQCSGENRLFGSDLNHSTTMTLKISQASTKRHLNQEWNREEKSICEIDMSMAQFSRMISSAGMGDGTPCTIRRQREGSLVMVPAISTPSVSRGALHMKEMEEEMREKLKEMQSLLIGIQALGTSSGAVSKKDLREMTANAIRIGEQLPGNLGFVQQQFRRAMETTVQDSKTEVEIFYSSVVQRLAKNRLDEESQNVAIEMQAPLID